MAKEEKKRKKSVILLAEFPTHPGMKKSWIFFANDFSIIRETLLIGRNRM